MNYPVINVTATGLNIKRIRKERGLKVKAVQEFLGFEQPQAIYKWESGQSLPSIDNLYAIARFFGVSMDDILVSVCQDVVVFLEKLCYNARHIFASQQDRQTREVNSRGIKR